MTRATTTRRRRGRLAAATAVALAGLVTATACTSAGSDETSAVGPTTPGTVAPATAAPATAAPGTLPPATEAPTTEAPTTEAPTTAPTTVPTTPAPTTAPPTTVPVPVPVTAARPPRPLPPKPGRPAPPEAIALPGPPVVGGEGLWTPVGTPVGGAPALEKTVVRANANGSVLAGIVWIDTTAVKGQLFAGTLEPGGDFGPFSVPGEHYGDILATFNSGFLLKECEGGMILGGRVVVPPRNGTAAVHIDTDGFVTVGLLGRDVSAGPGTADLRQNLPLLVDGGAVAASATDRDVSVWGKTLGSTPVVWRSGLGQRDDGTLVYVAGPSMSARMLGATMVAAGVVRGMELDINPEWVSFNVLVPNPANGSVIGEKLLPSMRSPGDRYLTDDRRDFFALYARPGA